MGFGRQLPRVKFGAFAEIEDGGSRTGCRSARGTYLIAAGRPRYGHQETDERDHANLENKTRRGAVRDISPEFLDTSTGRRAAGDAADELRPGIAPQKHRLNAGQVSGCKETSSCFFVERALVRPSGMNSALRS